MEATSFAVAEKKKKKKTVTDGDVRDAKAAKKQRKEEKRKQLAEQSAEEPPAPTAAPTPAPVPAALAAASSAEKTSSSGAASCGSDVLVDRTVNCRECGRDFIFSAAEQQWFLSKGYTDGRSRCKECTASRKARYAEQAAGASASKPDAGAKLPVATAPARGTLASGKLACWGCGTARARVGGYCRTCAAKADPARASNACFEWAKSGSCKRGAQCKFVHAA